MLFKKKSPPLPSVCIRSKNGILFEGLLKEIPIKESVIIEKSIHFFDDPEPCFIHRNAVRVRLIQEIHQELLSANAEAPGPLLLSYIDFTDIESCRLI